MTKYQRVFKQQTREWITSVVVLAVLGALAYGASLLGDDKQQEERQLSSAVQSVRSEATTMKNQIDKARASLKLYNDLNATNQNAGFTIDRERGRKLLDALKAEYKLTSLSVTMSPVTEDKEVAGNSKTVNVMATDIRLDFTGISDENALTFLAAMKREFPGYVRIKKITLSRDKEIGSDVVATVREGRVPPLVKGEITARWLGIKSTAPVTPGANSGNAAQPPAQGGGGA